MKIIIYKILKIKIQFLLILNKKFKLKKVNLWENKQIKKLMKSLIPHKIQKRMI
jgi:hypothetical protein